MRFSSQFICIAIVLLVGVGTRAEDFSRIGTSDAIVEEWIRATEKRGPVEASGMHFEFNAVTEVCSVSEWKSKLISPSHWELALIPLAESAIGSLEERNPQRRFQSKPLSVALFDGSVFHHCAKGHVNRVRLGHHQGDGFFETQEELFRLVPLNWIAFPHCYEDEIRSCRFDIVSPELVRTESDTEFACRFTPFSPRQQRAFREVTIIFEATTMLPKACQIKDATDTIRTVWTVTGHRSIIAQTIDPPRPGLTTLEIARQRGLISQP